MSAGPVDEGKIKKMYDIITCNPDEKSFEGTALGLLYTATSRATTLGDDNGLDSAIYFTGQSMRPDRIRNLTRKIDSNKEFKKAIKRRYWVNYIAARNRRSEKRMKRIMEKAPELLQWAASTTYSYNQLYDRL